MDASGWYWWAGIAALLIILLLLFRRGGFRLGAEAFGAKVEVEGKGHGEAPAEPKAAEPALPRRTPAVEARGRGNIAVGGNAAGTFVAGDRNRVGGEGGR